MPEIRLELPGDLVRKLDTEVELLGFDDREEYLRWIVGNRAAIEGGTERDQLLSEYQSRVAELEAQLETHDGSGAAEGAHVETSGAEAGAERSRATDGSGVGAQSDHVAAGDQNDRATSGGQTDRQTTGGQTDRSSASADADESDGRETAPGTQSTFADSTTADSRATDSTSADSRTADSTGAGSNVAGQSDARDGAVRAGETSDSPGSKTDESAATTDGSRRDCGSVNGTDTESGGVDETSGAAPAVEAAAQSTVSDLQGNFRPERVERFEDESLGSQASQLQGVEGERLDEFARRAVAKTRERLGREPTTGLDYRSQTRISRASSDVRPGEDLVDLDSLDVPGRSPDAMAPRREAVGAALAYLRDVGRAKRGDFIAELYAEYPAGYDSKSGWWRCIKRGLKDASVVDGGDGSRVWTYVPPGSREGELLGSGPERVVDPE